MLHQPMIFMPTALGETGSSPFNNHTCCLTTAVRAEHALSQKIKIPLRCQQPHLLCANCCIGDWIWSILTFSFQLNQQHGFTHIKPLYTNLEIQTKYVISMTYLHILTFFFQTLLAHYHSHRIIALTISILLHLYTCEHNTYPAKEYICS
jgi:hypothetical protein